MRTLRDDPEYIAWCKKAEREAEEFYSKFASFEEEST